MNISRLKVVYETSRDRRLQFSNQLNNYRDSGVLLGHWFEERARAEAETEELLDKYSKNQLCFQKLDKYVNRLSEPIQLTRNLDGYLHHGDIIRLRCVDEKGVKYYLAALPFNIAGDGTFDERCLALATKDARINVRCGFHAFRNNTEVPNHIPLMYGEIIQIATTEDTGHRFLNCEPKSFVSFAKQSKHQEVTWVKELCSRTLWKVFSTDKRNRRRLVGQYIPVNTDVIIQHLPTGQCLAFEKDTTAATTFGMEKEVSGHTYADHRKVEGIENRWQFEAPYLTSDNYGEPMSLPRTEIT